MTASLVRLPPVVLDEDAIEVLARCADAVGDGRVVLVGPQRTADGHELDPFVVAVAVAHHANAELGVAARVGAGRAASIIAREATAAQLLGACHALYLEGEAASCRDAATVIAALFVVGSHTVVTDTERVDGARNLPVPDVDGGPGIFWRDGDEVWHETPAGPRAVGALVELACTAVLPTPVDGELVELDQLLADATELAATLAR